MKKVIPIILILLFVACGEETKKADTSYNESKRIPVQESWNSTFKITENAQIKALVFSRVTRKFTDKRETLMDTLKINFFDDLGVKTTTLTSLFGKIDDQTKNMFAKDSVVAFNQDGVKLETEELHWNNRTKKITTEKFVTITTKDEIIQGYGFESDQNLKNYEIFEPVIKAETRKKKSEK